MKTYVILGDPTPLARPRFAYRKIYDSQKNQKVAATLQLQQQISNDELIIDKPLHLDVIFYMKTPATMSLKKKQLLYNQPHIFKPDLDNLIKYVCDISSGTIYSDDCIIYSITAKKIYSDKPRTEFTLRAV